MRVLLHPSGIWTAKQVSKLMIGAGVITALSFLFLAALLFPVIFVVHLLWTVLLACGLHSSRLRRTLDADSCSSWSWAMCPRLSARRVGHSAYRIRPSEIDRLLEEDQQQKEDNDERVSAPSQARPRWQRANHLIGRSYQMAAGIGKSGLRE
jgi:hypothetical protein